VLTFSKLNEWGGLGNQMWAIASTIGLARSNGTPFSLPHWNYDNYFQQRYTYFNGNIVPVKFTYLGAEYRDFKFEAGEIYDLEGYFQSWKYFENCKGEIYNFFMPLTYKATSKRVAIHVRRGDYLNLQHIHPVLPLSYYETAMDYFSGEKFTVYSDDIKWCIANFDLLNLDIEFIKPSQNPVVDLIRMAGHDKFIIANSSFSWWAAYLSRSEWVVAPDIWALNEDPAVIDDRLPKEWRRIHVQL